MRFLTLCLERLQKKKTGSCEKFRDGVLKIFMFEYYGRNEVINPQDRTNSWDTDLMTVNTSAWEGKRLF